MTKRRCLWAAGAVLAAYIALCWSAGLWLAEGTLHPPRKPLLGTDLAYAQEVASRNDSKIAEVAIVAADGVILRGWKLEPSDPSGRAVLLLHGLGDNRMGMIGYAEMLLSHGFTILMPDARAHGGSGGNLATFGLLESADIRGWADWLYTHDHASCVFGIGESMGAAQLLQAAGSDNRFCAVVAESPFASFREIAYDRMGQFFHVGPWLGRIVLRPVVEIAFWHARHKYGLDFEQVSPDRSVAHSSIPVLLVHGQIDSNIPVRHSRKIAIDNSRVNLWEVAGADHCGAIAVAPIEFEQKVIRWFAGHNHLANTISSACAAPRKESIPQFSPANP